MKNTKATNGLESPSSNRLFEKIKDINKVIIPRGMVLLEVIQVTRDSGIILPSTIDRSNYVYHKVIKSGSIDFKANHPDSLNLDEGLTKVGNIVLTMRTYMFQLLIKNNKEYVIIPENNILSQVTIDNFTV